MTSDLDEQVNLLRDEAGSRKVRAIARTDSALAEALFDVAAGHRRYWDRISWRALLKRLDSCTLTVDAWLKEREA